LVCFVGGRGGGKARIVPFIRKKGGREKKKQKEKLSSERKRPTRPQGRDIPLEKREEE